MGRLKRLALGTATMVLAAFLLYWCFREINYQSLWISLSNTEWPAPVGGMAILLAVLLVNTLQWQILLPNRLSFRRMFRIIGIKAMTANLVPWGNAVAIYHLGEREKAGKKTALAVMAADLLTDGLSKLALLLLVAWTAPLPFWMKKGGGLMALVVAGLFIALFFLDRAIRDYRRLLAVTLLAILGKACEVAAIFLVQVGAGIDLPFWAPFLLAAALNLATLLPVTPGNLGVYEATAFSVYRFIGVEPAQALSLALLHHAVYLIPMILPGYCLSVKWGIGLGKVFHERNAALR